MFFTAAATIFLIIIGMKVEDIKYQRHRDKVFLELVQRHSPDFEKKFPYSKDFILSEGYLLQKKEFFLLWAAQECTLEEYE